MTDGIHNPDIVIRRMTRSQYMECLVELVSVLIKKHGEITVGALQELANRAILQYGIDNAAARVREER